MNANSYQSPGTTGGNKEWLDGTLTILEPEETPFTSLVNKATDAKGTFHEVIADRLRAPRTSGTREGESGPKGGNKAQRRARFGSYLHRWHDTYSVTDVQEAITRAGGNAVIDDEYGAAKSKCVREMKRDMEATLLTAMETQGGTDDEMKTRGAFKWLTTTAQTPAVPADYRPPAAQVVSGISELLESTINGVLKSLKSNYGGAREYMLLAGNDYVEDIDLFAVQDTAGGAASRYAYPVTVEGGAEKTVSVMVKIFQTSFGRVAVHSSDFINVDASAVANAKSALILNRELWKLSFLEGLHAQDDWKDAGGEGGFCKAIGGLFCRMPRGNAAIYNTLN
jgi:hypothetical protein